MIQAAIVLIVVALISGAGFVTGKKWERSVWQPAYSTLAAQMAKLQSDLNLANKERERQVEITLAEITVYGDLIDVQAKSMEREVNVRVENYLNRLAANGVRYSSSDSTSDGNSTDTSLASRVISIRNDEGKLARSLGAIERGVVQLLRERDHAVNRNILSKQYLTEVESKL